MTKKKTSIATHKVGNCTITLVLDKRTNKNTKDYPLSICFNLWEDEKQKRYYHHLGEFLTEKYFSEVCSVSSSRSSLLNVRKEWEAVMEGYRDKLVKVSNRQKLTMSLIRTVLSGVDVSGESASFLGVWSDVIARMRKEGRAGTAENYSWALSSFRKIIGDIEGFSVNKDVLEKWNDGMRNGVSVDGKLDGKVADATRGMYLRTCRVVWNECTRLGFLTDVEYPFSNKNNSLISIPRGKLRQQSYLSIDEMTQLYDVFIEKRYPDTWSPFYIERAHQSLGLFLVQYLCNGFNLADAARLEYNSTYWKEGGRAFEFMRKKTAARSNNMSVVIVPIIPPLQRILDEIAAPPAKGAYVFPFLFKGVLDEVKRRKIQRQENSNIRDRLQRICKDVMKWDKIVSGTWARHSFATNLKLAGVEEEYIAESMGHSHGNDVTAGYMDKYPLEIRFRNNAKLLRTEEPKPKIDLDNLSKEEMKELLKKILQR